MLPQTVTPVGYSEAETAPITPVQAAESSEIKILPLNEATKIGIIRTLRCWKLDLPAVHEQDSRKGSAMMQMIYTSEASHKFSTEELQELLQVSRRNNMRDGLTGMLLFEDNTFLQVLEGENEIVEKTFERISKDPRHRKILLIARLELDQRTFHDWEMGFFDASGGNLLQLPGYTGFLNRKTVDLEKLEEGDKAREVLLNFKQGAWHRHGSA